jgi:hypothetical protein
MKETIEGEGSHEEAKRSEADVRFAPWLALRFQTNGWCRRENSTTGLGAGPFV